MLTSDLLPNLTWLHRVPAGGKLVALAVVSVALMSVSPLVLGASAGVVALMVLSLKQDTLQRVARFLYAFWPVMAVIFAFHIALGTIVEGALTLTRMMVLMTLAYLVTLTTTMQAMMDAVLWLLKPLTFFGFRPRKLALAVTLSLRFIPLLLDQWQKRREAWYARTGRRLPLRLMVNLLIDALRMAEHMSEALYARGFDAS
jgi:biotin transport system permease protein